MTKNFVKKISIIFVVNIVAISLLYFYGEFLITKLSDLFQSKICSQKLCINKPKGWIPVKVRRDNNIFYFNILKESFENRKIYSDFNKSFDLVLTKGFDLNQYILIWKESELSTNCLGNKNEISKLKFKGHKYLIVRKDDFYVVVYLNKKIFFIMKKLNMNLISKLLFDN